MAVANYEDEARPGYRPPDARSARLVATSMIPIVFYCVLEPQTLQWVPPALCCHMAEITAAQLQDEVPGWDLGCRVRCVVESAALTKG
jgi:hypothetical protein